MLLCVELIFVLAVVLSGASIATLALPLLGIATEVGRARGRRALEGSAEHPDSARDVEVSVRRRLYGGRPGAVPVANRTGSVPVGSGLLIHDRYRLLKRLGAGGMASVYRAHDELLDRYVAVKLIADRFAADPAHVERLHREARLCARLAHSNIPAVLDAGARPRDFIVMELVDGLDAYRLLHRRGRLTPGQAVHVLAQICDALTHAHDRGVVHGDVSPSNILLRRCDGAAKLADFGLACRTGEGAPTHAGELLGTPGHVAPEVLWGYEATPRSDLFCLGVVAYRFLAGPTSAGDADATAPLMTAARPLPPLADVRSDLPRGLVAAVQRAVSVEPDSRQDSVAEFRAELIGQRRRLSAAPSAGVTPRQPVRTELPRAA